MNRKLNVLCILGLLLSAHVDAYSQSSQTKGPTVASETCVKNEAAWNFIPNILRQDGQTAGATVGYVMTIALSCFLSSTGYGFSIPSNATITGIQANIRKAGINEVADQEVSLISNGTAVGTAKAYTTLWPATLTFSPYGGSSDKWGYSWTPALVNNSSFGVGIQCVERHFNDDNVCTVDYTSITVFYTVP